PIPHIVEKIAVISSEKSNILPRVVIGRFTAGTRLEAAGSHLAPFDPVPLPGVIQKAAVAIIAAEQHGAVARAIVGERELRSCRRWTAGGELRPHNPVPRPGIGENAACTFSAE